MPPVPLPSYPIELIRAEVISIVPKRSRKSEIGCPPKSQLADMAMINAMRIPRVTRTLRIWTLVVATARCAVPGKTSHVKRPIGPWLQLSFLALNVIVYLLFENLEGQRAIFENGIVELALVKFFSQFVLCASA